MYPAIIPRRKGRKVVTWPGNLAKNARPLSVQSYLLQLPQRYVLTVGLFSSVLLVLLQCSYCITDSSPAEPQEQSATSEWFCKDCIAQEINITPFTNHQNSEHRIWDLPGWCHRNHMWYKGWFRGILIMVHFSFISFSVSKCLDFPNIKLSTQVCDANLLF